jgi:hypothetical protein
MSAGRKIRIIFLQEIYDQHLRSVVPRSARHAAVRMRSSLVDYPKLIQRPAVMHF